MSPPGKRPVGRLSLARSTPRAYRRHADQEDDEREPASDSSLPVSRETSPAPEKRPPYHPRQSGGARCHYRICRASPTDSTRSVPPKADVSATLLRGSSTSYPIGRDELDGSRYRPLGYGIRLLLRCGGLRPTCLRQGRGHRVSSSSLESRLLRSVTSAESHGALPSDTSPLVSRETDSQTQCGRHGSDDVIPRAALPG